MYKYILQGAGDINWMALFALLTFFLMFVISLFMVFFRSKEYVNKMSQMPLHDSYSSTTKTEAKHENSVQ